MAQPTTYNRAYNFSNYQSEAPSTPLPADKVDLELSRVKQTLDEIMANLALIQRDDTALANNSVSQDQISPSLEIGVSPPSAWTTSTNYIKGQDSVFKDGIFYRCLLSHTSGTFATDLAAGDWELIADFSAIAADASHTSFTAAGGLISTTVQDALEELDTEKAPKASPALTGTPTAPTATAGTDTTQIATTAFVNAAVAALVNSAPSTLDTLNELATALGNDANFSTTVTNEIASKLDKDGSNIGDATAQETFRNNIGVSPIPSGAVMSFAMSTAPTGWLECDGSAVSRTTYANLFTAIGTVHGTGDGSTTFNLPDYRGQFLRGWDHGAGNDPDAASRTDAGDGSTTGDNVGTKQGHAFQTHRHSTTLQNRGGNNAAAHQDAAYVNDDGPYGSSTSYTNTNPYTGSYSSETRPKNVNVMYCIKV